ncbi:hypothetical protein TCAL_13568, partial [Tigriopus californicus]
KRQPQDRKQNSNQEPKNPIGGVNKGQGSKPATIPTVKSDRKERRNRCFLCKSPGHCINNCPLNNIYASLEMQEHLTKDPIPMEMVPGRIHDENFRDFWVNKLKPSSLVLDAISRGYIASLEKSKSVYRVSEKPHLVLPVQVSHPEGRRKRLISNAAQSLNKYIIKRSVKLDHLALILPDILQRYYHLLVREDQQKLLGCHWKLKSGGSSFFQWRVAFLGISDLIYFFTKLIKPLIAYCRRHGVAIFIYIDDLLTLGHSNADCFKKVAFVRSVFQRAGFVESYDKFQHPKWDLSWPFVKCGLLYGSYSERKTRKNQG